MNTGTKVIIMIVSTLTILFVLAIIKESGGGAVMWLGAIAIPMIYKSLFGKKDNDDDGNNENSITLDKNK